MNTSLVFARKFTQCVVRNTVLAVVCLMIAFPPQCVTALAATTPENPEIPDEPAHYSGAFGYTGPLSQNGIPQPPPSVAAFLDDLQNGRIGSRPAKDADSFHLTNQDIEIYDHGQTRRYDLNKSNVEIPLVAFTSLKIVYDSKTGDLMLDAYRGLDKNGENGILVARQTLRGVDVATSAQDAELFQFVDSKMNLHAIDLGLVALQVFKSPIPIFQNLWQPTPEVEAQLALRAPGAQLTSGFLTRGTKPLNLLPAVLTPHDETGKVRLNAGDFYVANGSDAVAIFARETTYSQILRGYKTLQWQAALLSTDTEVQLKVEKMIDEMQGEFDRQELALQNEKMSPQARFIIGSLNQNSIKSLENRAGSTATLKKNAFDSFTTADWITTYTEISANAPKDATDKANEEQWFKLINKVNEKTVAAAKAEALVPEKEANVSKIKGIRKAVFSGTALKALGILLTAAAAGFPYAYDHFEALNQIKVIAWSYDALFPAVLKDAVYRTPLLLSLVSLAAIWPEAVGFSALVGKTLNAMAEKVKSEVSRKAIYIKDLARNWGHLNNWQRINSFGMRLYAWMILPYWRVLIQHIAQQKTFFSAVNSGLNPLEKLLADSEIGKKLGLTEDQRIGLNQVFGSKKAEKIALNMQIQSAKWEENKKLDSIALLVAATLVAEKHKMDPAMLMLLGKDSSDGLELNKISELLDTHEKKAEWQMLSHLLIKQMSGLKKSSIVVDNHMKQLIEQYYQAGEKIAKKVDEMSDLREKIERFRMSFSSQLSNKLIGAANFAVQDHEFLKTVYTDEFVSDQVKKEFTIDHLMVVGIIGLYRERADLSHPEHLAADPHGFLWTSRAHWFDIFQNTFAHFFLSGAQMALVYQKVKPQVAANYAPIEDYQFESKARQQGIASASKDWMGVFNPIKSDLGGIITKRFLKRFTTMTAGITMMIALRYGVFNQDMATAWVAWTFNFITAQWFFGWIWDPVQRGNQMEGEHIEEMTAKLKSARRKVNRGDLEEGRSELSALYKKYNPKVLELVDISTLSKNDLLALSVVNPPVFTEANKWLSWFTTWTAAVGSTVMAIPLSVILMDQKLLWAADTWYTWVPISVALYTASYFLSAKYATKYRDYFLALKQKWAARAQVKAGESQADLVPGGGGRCEALFVPAAG